MSEPGAGPPAEEQLLTVSQRVRADAVVLTAVGEVDSMTAPRLRAGLDAALDVALRSAVTRRVVVDLLDVTFLASSGLAALEGAARQAGRLSEPLLIVVDHRRPALRPIQITGLGDVLVLRHSVEEALTRSDSPHDQRSWNGCVPTIVPPMTTWSRPPPSAGREPLMAMATTQEFDDRWILPLRGNTLTAIDIGEQVDFMLDSGVRIVVGPGALFSHGPITAPDVDARTLARWDRDVITECVGTQILSAVGFMSGAFRVVLSNGWHLNITATPDPFVPATVLDGNTALWTRSAPA